MNILGISAFYHDSAAALVQDGTIVAAAQEERFTRKKHDPAFPSHAIRYCLNESGLGIGDLDAVVFYDKPFLKFERLLETYYSFAPKGVASFVMSMPVWIKEKIFLKDILYKELNAIEKFDRKKIKLLFPEHHLSHAASAFFPSQYKDAAILTVDGVGEWATASICHGDGNKIKVLRELHFPHSVGLLYSAFTYFLGFRVNSGEYKLMGLAPYGIKGSQRVEDFKKIICEKLVDIRDDGSIWMNQNYFRYAHGLRMVKDSQWEKLFGFPVRKDESVVEQCHADLALAIQEVTEEILIRMAREAKRLTGSDSLCMAGGVALNCVANGKILRENIFKNIFIQPAAGDAGGALGAALAGYHIYFGKERKTGTNDSMQGSFLGPGISETEIEQLVKTHRIPFKKYDSFNELAGVTCRHIAEGKIAGWVQGRMEFGPRALGNRSILADPRNTGIQKKLNLKTKFREGFRPFAPAVMAEDCVQYFDLNVPSPYMVLIAEVKKERRKNLPENYNTLKPMERLYVERSDIQAVTHVDFSARVQTVHRETNETFWKLINTFKGQTGCCLLVNTSFNVRGEPIVCSAEDAFRCFMRSGMDILVINNYLFDKTEMPAMKEYENLTINKD